MAEIKLKGEKLEKAIAILTAQMPKEVSKRAWTPGAFAAIITNLAEQHGAKFATPDGRKAFMADMRDGDCAYSSNMKKYLASRGMLPTTEAATAEYQ